MNAVLKIFLSMSFSGTLLILAFFAVRPFLKDKLSRQWQYYIWLIVIFRLLIPFGPEANLSGKAGMVIHQALEERISLSGESDLTADQDGPSAADTAKKGDDLPAAASSALSPADYVWLIWLGAALVMLIRKVTFYQSFVRYVNAGASPVADMALLELLSEASQQTGIKRPVEFATNSLISTPLLIGFFHPCIILPNTEVEEKDLRYILLHELTHYRRQDMLYKWLVQVTLCLHWFNPFVHLMSREITKACEFSCDEAVLAKAGYDGAQDYGRTLLNAMVAAGKYKGSSGALTLNANKKLLKERISAIMEYEKKSGAVRVLMAALTVGILFGAFFIGVYPVEAADSTGPALWEKNRKAERFYEAGSLPLFEIAFSGLNAEMQDAWMNRIYEEDEIAFFSVSVDQLSSDSPLIQQYAEKFYRDDAVAFFSVLAERMSEDVLDAWLDRALEDGQISFQSVLYDKMSDKKEEKDAWEEDLAERQREEYRAYGITVEGKSYFYEDQLVNVFLDIRGNRSFYTLDMNPEGTVNIRVNRNEKDEITGVSCMTEAEVEELLSN